MIKSKKRCGGCVQAIRSAIRLAAPVQCRVCKKTWKHLPKPVD